MSIAYYQNSMTDPNELRKRHDEILVLTTDIVPTYARNNQMSTTELSDLTGSVPIRGVKPIHAQSDLRYPTVVIGKFHHAPGHCR